MLDSLKCILHGFLIGIASIIPGVSGGSMALALGVYERLIAAVSHFGPRSVGATMGVLRFSEKSKHRFATEWRRIDGTFLCWIAVGGALSVVIFSKVMFWLLKFYHDPTYGFFTGLILVSIWVPLKMIRRFRFVEGFSCLAALGLVLSLTLSADPEQQHIDAKRKLEMKRASSIEQTHVPQPDTIPSPLDQVDLGRMAFLVLCGAIAISAMVLPGVSGSFIMILLGVYFDVLQAVKDWDMVIISLFAGGCVLGLLLFTRLLKWVLARFHDVTIAFLTGLMAGSLLGLWPFRDFKLVQDNNIDFFERVDFGWIVRPIDENTFATIVAFLVGSGFVIFFLKLDQANAQKKGG